MQNIKKGTKSNASVVRQISIEQLIAVVCSVQYSQIPTSTKKQIFERINRNQKFDNG
jgi:hypothetical protein